MTASTPSSTEGPFGANWATGIASVSNASEHNLTVNGPRRAGWVDVMGKALFCQGQAWSDVSA